MDTVGEAILKHIAATLTTQLSGVTVERFRLRPYEKGELPAVAVSPISEEPEYGPGPQRKASGVKRMFRVSVRASVLGDPADEDLDILRGNIVAALMHDRSLGGLALGIGEAGTVWEGEAGSDFTFGVVTIHFDVLYSTRSDDARVQI
jgi:hypothetical protein